MTGALDAVLPALACPVCRAALHRDGPALGCAGGHRFDVSRQGYVNLTVGHRAAGTADTADMVQARARFLGGGHYDPVRDAVADLVAAHAPGEGVVVDLAGGTGHYLSGVLDRLPDAAGLCLDVSPPALRRAARAHPRAAAAGADAWRVLPLAGGAARAVLSVFGPRTGAEIDRILGPGGVLVTASAGAAHLQELREPLGLLGVDPDKSRREQAAFVRFVTADLRRLRYPLVLTREQALAVAAMGPTARHASATELATRAALLPGTVDVSVDVRVCVYRRPSDLG